MWDSLQSQGLQHARPPYSSPTPGVYSDSVMSSNHVILCHPILLLPSTFPSIRVCSNESVLHNRWPKDWSFSFSISLSNEYSGLFPLGLTGLITLQSKGLSRVLSNTTVQKHQFFSSRFCLQSNSHIHTWLLEKFIDLTRWTFVSKVMSLLFNMLSGLFFQGARVLISWLQSLSAVILEPRKIMSVTIMFPHLFAMKGWDQMPLS